MSSLPRNGLEILTDWANAQDGWVRAVVGEVVATRRELPEPSVDAAYALFLAEKGLSDEPPRDVPQLSAGANPADHGDDLRLLRLAELSGVNALAPGQEIAFNTKVTVLFGENAAGKTGYVRVLKRVASVRSAEPILGNFRSAAANGPRATIEYSLAGTKHTLAWNGEAGVSPFPRMSAFDSRAVALHVDEDLTYIFTPGELALFRHAHEAVNAVKGRLETARADAVKPVGTLLDRFERDAAVYPKIETLGASTRIPELEALADVTREEEATLQALKDAVDALNPRAAQSHLQVATAHRDLSSAVQRAASAVAAFDWAGFNVAVSSLSDAQASYEAITRTAFSGENVPGLFGESWSEFIQAGDAYQKGTGNDHAPHEGDPCPYCRQALDKAAGALLRKYHDYCNNQAKRALDAATAAARRLAGQVAAVDAVTLKATCERTAAGFVAPALPPTVVVNAISFLSDLIEIQLDVANGRAVDASALVARAKDLSTEAAAATVDAQTAADRLGRQADERRKELEGQTAKLRSLQNRLALRALLPEIRQRVERAQWADKAGPFLNSRIPTVLRTLTEQSKIASKQLLDQDFQRLFESECEALRAPKVTLDFPGRKGQSARKKVLAPNHLLSEILSEGEQKVIAIADFLAEASLRKTSAPIVFDDPVNSLDYKRLQYVVDRIVSLSATRQVVVFTHNIWFATELLSRFDKATADCTYYGVSDLDGAVGIVNKGSHPRWDTVKQLNGRVNQLLQSAGSVQGEAQTAIVESAYGVIRSWCEVVVEQELLAGVTQRYQPNVAMTKLAQIKPDRFNQAKDVILSTFEKACRMMPGHSQPLETLSIRPTLADLKDDWKKLQDARNAYLK